MNDLWGAFFQPNITFLPKASGTLDGLTYAVKDVYDLEGHVSSAGSPDWKRTHQAAVENAHFGTPVNPKATERIPGGSSSGSAVAVAAGLVDFAMGTDTGGSIRVPASYCGIYGMRPTQSSVFMQGVIPLAPIFDTAGWMARDLTTMRKVGNTLLKDQQAKNNSKIRRLIMASDVWDILDIEYIKKAKPLLKKISHCVNTWSPVELEVFDGRTRAGR